MKHLDDIKNIKILKLIYSFSEYVIQFEQTVNEIHDYIKEYETSDSELQSILQNDIISQKDKARYKVFCTRHIESWINGIILRSGKCDISVEMIDMCCRDTQQTKTTMEELYSYFKDANNKYNIYVNLYNDLKIEIKRYDNFIKQYGEKMKELARALDDLVSRVRANRNILVERLYPIIKPIFNMFIPLK